MVKEHRFAPANSQVPCWFAGGVGHRPVGYRPVHAYPACFSPEEAFDACIRLHPALPKMGIMALASGAGAPVPPKRWWHGGVHSASEITASPRQFTKVPKVLGLNDGSDIFFIFHSRVTCLSIHQMVSFRDATCLCCHVSPGSAWLRQRVSRSAVSSISVAKRGISLDRSR